MNPGRRESRLIWRFTIATLVAGAGWGIAGALAGFPPGAWAYVVGAAGLLGAWMLLQRHAFLSSSALALMSMMLTFAVFIVLADSPPIAFTTELRKDVFIAHGHEAVHVMAVFTSIFGLFLLARSPKEWLWRPPALRERAIARVSLLPSLLISQVLLVATLRGPLITHVMYGSEEFLAASSPVMSTVKGLEAVAVVVMVYPVIAALRGYGAGSRAFRVTVVLVGIWVTYLWLLRGVRSTVAVWFLVVASLYYFLARSRQKGVVLGAMGVAGFLLLQIFASVRHAASFMGLWPAIAYSWDRFWQPMVESDWSLPAIERFPQAFWNLLDTIDLYEAGIRRSGETYFNLVVQAVPEFVANLFGFVRPLPEPWVLAQYRPHGGDIFIVAEAYWNGGLLAVVGLAIALGLLFAWLERLYRRLPALLAFGYYGSLGLVINLLGSSQGFARWLEVVLALTAVAHLLLSLRSGRRTALKSASS